jgi:methylated-DNA-[protein]-cysteine S-methyltransferase
MATLVIDTMIGPLTVQAGPDGVRRIEFGAHPAPGDDDTSAEATAVAAQAADELEQYFAGTRTTFTMPLDWSASTGFRHQVLRALAAVPYGEVVTYGELAARAGNPKAARAVGSAMATNPWPIVIACHRVVRAGGQLGHYGGGQDVKRRLVDFERAALAG